MYFPIMLNAKQGDDNSHLLTSFGMTRSWFEPSIFRTPGGRSKLYTTESVCSHNHSLLTYCMVKLILPESMYIWIVCIYSPQQKETPTKIRVIRGHHINLVFRSTIPLINLISGCIYAVFISFIYLKVKQIDHLPIPDRSVMTLIKTDRQIKHTHLF